jgi:hypothetical protein
MPITGSVAYNSARNIMGIIRSLLNDANVNANARGTVVSAQRAGGTAQITTKGAHGLIVGDQVELTNISVGANNFNGVFSITGTPSTTQFQYLQTGAQDETQGGGFYSGVGLGAVFTDAVLIPYLNQAYRKVQRGLANIGSNNFINDDVLLVVAAVTGGDSGTQTSITDNTAPPNQLPVDLLEPVRIWERPNGSTDDFFDMTNLTQHGGLPSRPQGQDLSVWEWRMDGIYFIGATQDIQIRLRYKRALPSLADGTSVLLIRNCQEAVSYLAAALAAGARGSPAAQAYDTVGMDALDDLVSTAVRAMQATNYRPKGYSKRRGYTPF